jgi:hypothetical protein
MHHIERIVVDEGVGPDSELVAQFRERLGDRQVAFIFLAREHPGTQTAGEMVYCFFSGAALTNPICRSISLSMRRPSFRGSTRTLMLKRSGALQPRPYVVSRLD